MPAATTIALVAAIFIDTDLQRQLRPALLLLALAVVQIGAGAGVVESGQYFAATAVHLAIAPHAPGYGAHVGK